MTSKGAAHPNRPETAPPSDGGAVSAGTAAGAPVDSGAPAPPGDAVNDQGNHDHAEKDAADKPASGTDDATATTDGGDSTIDLEVTLSTDAKAAAETTAGDETEDAGTDADAGPDAAEAESAEGAVNTNGKETDVYKGKTAEGIYEWQGDNLKLCYSLPGKPRPTKFDSDEKNGTMLFVLARGASR